MITDKVFTLDPDAPGAHSSLEWASAEQIMVAIPATPLVAGAGAKVTTGVADRPPLSSTTQADASKDKDGLTVDLASPSSAPAGTSQEQTQPTIPHGATITSAQNGGPKQTDTNGNGNDGERALPPQPGSQQDTSGGEARAQPVPNGVHTSNTAAYQLAEQAAATIREPMTAPHDVVPPNTLGKDGRGSHGHGQDILENAGVTLELGDMTSSPREDTISVPAQDMDDRPDLETRALVNNRSFHDPYGQEPLENEGLGRFVDEPGHYIDLDDEGDEAGWRSALASGTQTPSHPADPKGHHAYWSTFRNGKQQAPSIASEREGEPSSGPAFSQALKPSSLAHISPFRRGSTLEDHHTSNDEAAPQQKQRHGMVNALGLSRFVPKRHGTVPAATKDGAMPTMTNEMIAGALPVMILKTWLDRDEDGHRAVPVLIGNLRFRIGDSMGIRDGSRHTGREIFKIECEYGDGAIKWIIYRELRDFLMLHAHYKAANLGTRVAGLRSSRRVEIPDFPRNSLPGWAREKVDGVKDKDKGKEKMRKIGLPTPTGSGDREPPSRSATFGPASRAALQQYLVDLIRAVMFRPESNRLCIFFELSALTVGLAPRGGFQGKAGFLRILSPNASRRSNQPGLLPSSWRLHRAPKWFIVRESYSVMTEGPEDTEIFDVFMFDSDFEIERPKRVLRQGLHLISGASGKQHRPESDTEDFKQLELQDDDDRDVSQHTFYISNSQNRLKLVAKNARLMHQYILSMERVAMQCNWTKKNRFDSFAPIRVNAAAQWLVDGRDYFWNLSRAISMAKSRIYIHDWWISCEIYLRRPGDERYRLDNLLKRKAEEGVRIFIIIYNEVSTKTTPVESLYVKKTLTSLHPNIMIQRSPSHLPSGPTGALYWSHHEKLCVIDEMIAFMGGLDLCFGRWDSSQHILVDEDFTSPDGPDGPVWRGKDYWNERVLEFQGLTKPFEDAFDRGKTPRMPWHDVGLHMVGQPARDLCRHFCQRWNHLLRIKNHTRKMPFLLPPADLTERELVDLKLEGTCEVQIVRSCGPWSMGTSTKVEHSIQNAYTKCIALSEHFVYIENQFFITSTWLDESTHVENKIGDALVARAIRAHRDGESWRACIVIPLLPGAAHAIDSSEGRDVRLILECQNRSICRGAHSIFSRLRKEGIDPDDYITFFSLRGWAKFGSGALTTEQVYIHAKTMIIDDRVVITGSANINERSMRGDRDSELAAVIRDTDMIDGHMAGKPFKVGRYAHTLRMRLMREHVGIDVDAIEEDELMHRKPVADASGIALWDPDNEQQHAADTGIERRGITRVKKSTARARFGSTISNAVGGLAKGLGENVKLEAENVAEKIQHPLQALDGRALNERNESAHAREDMGPDGNPVVGFASSVVPTLEERTIAEQVSKGKGKEPNENGNTGRANGTLVNGHDHSLSDIDSSQASGDTTPTEPTEPTVSPKAQRHVGEFGNRHHHEAEKFGGPALSPDFDDIVPRSPEALLRDEEETPAARTLLRKHLGAKPANSQWAVITPTPRIDANQFADPLDRRFWDDMWVATAVHNTQIFRKVFRCTPDDLVTTWAQYTEFANHLDKFGRVHDTSDDTKVTHDPAGSGGGVVGPPGSNAKAPQTADVLGTGSISGALSALTRSKSSTSTSTTEMLKTPSGGEASVTGKNGGAGNDQPSQQVPHGTPAQATAQDKDKDGNNDERKPSGENDPWAQWELDEMEELLNNVRGHLVIYPTRFLEAEDMANNFLFNQERILPIQIYD